jgi:hypothetical protein
LIRAGDRKIRYEINKLIYSILSEDELPEEWKESITVPVCKKDDKTDCNNFRGISLLSTTYKIWEGRIILGWFLRKWDVRAST